MKKSIKNILVILIGILVFTSCTKEPKKHSIKFELSFSSDAGNGGSNGIEVGCKPAYSDTKPVIYKSQITPGFVWSYQYLELKDGDDVHFIVNSQLNYRFEMRVYIDDKMVSYRKISTSSVDYYATITESQSGLNNSSHEKYPIISFKYDE